MAITDSMKNGGGRVSSTENGASDVASQLDQLAELCSVLGINHKQRLKELGIHPDMVVGVELRSCLADTIRTLRGIKDSRFKKLKVCSTELIALWKTSMRSLSKSISLDDIYAVADAKSADEIKTEKLLSTHWLTQVDAEMKRFENTDEAKYIEKQKKLFHLMKQAHLTHSEVKFDPNATVSAYKKEIIAVKRSIKLAKSALLCRKEMIFRVERLEMAISRGYDLTSINVLVNRAKEAAGALISTSSKRVPTFDGLDVYIHIRNLWSMAISLAVDLGAELKRNSEAEDRVAEIRKNNTVALTRSRSRLPSTAQDGKADSVYNPQFNVPSNKSEDLPKNWTAQDTKRVIHLVFNVTDLEGTIKCYTECFGMSMLSRSDEDDVYNYAYLGYGPQEKKTSLFLVQSDEKVHIGEAFGHVSISNADVINLTKAVAVSCFCKVVQRPCRLSGSSMSIAFVVDPCGLMFEVVEDNHPRSEPISRVMLYVEDIGRSIHFYEKALGMRVMKRRDQEFCKIVFLGYGEENEETVLELRCYDKCKDYDHGTAFAQFAVGTLDLDKSFEALKAALLEDIGGKILQEPSDDVKNCSFLDPDGWKWVLMNYTEEIL